MEFWADHDDDCHGDKDYIIDDPEYQAGAMWSCCEKRGDKRGCKIREHDVWAKKKISFDAIRKSKAAPQASNAKRSASDADLVLGQCEVFSKELTEKLLNDTNCCHHPGKDFEGSQRLDTKS